MAKKTFTTGEVILQSGIYKTPSSKKHRNHPQ